MKYRIVAPSARPLVASLVLLLLAEGLVRVLQQRDYGWILLGGGIVAFLSVVAGWFQDAINDEQGNTEAQEAQSNHVYRWSVGWFIFSEFALFATFFAVLFYVRLVTIPWLSGVYGHAKSALTHSLLWPEFAGTWPLLTVPDTTRYTAPEIAMVAWGLPAINTAILLLSGVTVTCAHVALHKNKGVVAVSWLVATVLLGGLFLGLQAWEYLEAYTHMGLTFSSGLYGNLFFLMTGFHGVHVFLGVVTLAVITFRIAYGSINSKNRFAFEAASWYWHFVDVVWLLLFVCVYWI